MSKEDNDIITEEIRRKILNLAQFFSAVVNVKGAASCIHVHVCIAQLTRPGMYSTIHVHVLYIHVLLCNNYYPCFDVQ